MTRAQPLPHVLPARAAVAPGAHRASASTSGVLTAILSFVWPGLGQLAAGRWRRAMVLGVPPALALALAATMAATEPAAMAVALLSPTVALLAIGLIAVHGAWRVFAIVDAARIRRGRTPSRLAMPAAITLSLVVVLAHIAAGAVVQSFATAGAEIFQGDRPAGGAAIDELLGGTPVSGGGTPVSGGGTPVSGGGTPDGGPRPPHAGAPGAGATIPPPMTDTNSDGVIDWNDDGWIEDPPDEGWQAPIDDQQPGEPELPPAAPGEPDVTPPPLEPVDTSGGHSGDGPINVLFVGLDSGLGRTHSLTDTLILASYHPGRDRLTMISIPRDTGRLPLYRGGTYQQRINTFLNYARANPRLFPEGAISALMREVGYVLGTRVHYYAATNLDGLPRVVDLVGGITVTLDRPIADPRWNLYLQPGVHHLDGQSVMPYVRSRYGEGNSDWQRARRQQQVIRAVAARVKDPAVALKLPQIIDGMTDVVRTNVPRDQVSTLLRILERANEASTEHIVLSPNAYARRIPVAETGGRYMTELNMRAIRQLSLRIFGAHSRYD